MVFDLPPTIYIAQVYNCDAYGAAAYNSCPETSTNSPGGTPSQTSSTNSTTTTNESQTGDESPIDTPQTTQQPPSKPAPSQPGKDIELVNPTNTIAALDWTTLIPIALILSVLVAVIVLLYKKHRRPPLPPAPPTYF